MDAADAERSVKAELRLEDLVLNEATLRTSPMLPYVADDREPAGRHPISAAMNC